MRMRPWLSIFTTALAFTTLHACSSDESKSSMGGDASTPEEKDDAATGTDQDDGEPGASQVDTTTESVDVDGTSRDYVLSVPKNYDASRPYPLILALHGDGQDAKGFVGFSKLEKVTGDKVILAYPDHSEDLFTDYENNTDQKMIEAIIQTLKGRFSIDASKVWGFGYSKGAYQLNEIACKRPGVLKAMAIHAGGAPQTRDPNNDSIVVCPNAIGLPAFVTHGGNDDPGGGEFGAAYWASRANCKTTRSPTTPDICEAYDGCDPGKPVVFCVVPKQPHYPMYADAAAHSWAWFESL
jgi:polyhydroxybutyrate depolymerase